MDISLDEHMFRSLA